MKRIFATAFMTWIGLNSSLMADTFDHWQENNTIYIYAKKSAKVIQFDSAPDCLSMYQKLENVKYVFDSCLNDHIDSACDLSKKAMDEQAREIKGGLFSRHPTTYRASLVDKPYKEELSHYLEREDLDIGKSIFLPSLYKPSHFANAHIRAEEGSYLEIMRQLGYAENEEVSADEKGIEFGNRLVACEIAKGSASINKNFRYTYSIDMPTSLEESKKLYDLHSNLLSTQDAFGTGEQGIFEMGIVVGAYMQAHKMERNKMEEVLDVLINFSPLNAEVRKYEDLTELRQALPKTKVKRAKSTSVRIAGAES